MPIYEYRCGKCAETFEVIHKADDDCKDLQCPKCGSGAPERILSVFCSGGSKGSTGAAAGGHSAPGHS